MAKLGLNFGLNFSSHDSAHKILVLIAYVKTPLITAYAALSSKVRGLNFGLCLHLHPYFMCVSSDCSGKSAHMLRLT